MFDRGRGRGVQRGNRRRSDCTDTRTQTQRRRRKKQKSPQRSRSDETLQESIYRKASGKQKRKTKAQHAAGGKKVSPGRTGFPLGSVRRGQCLSNRICSSLFDPPVIPGFPSLLSSSAPIASPFSAPFFELSACSRHYKRGRRPKQQVLRRKEGL